MRMARRHGHHAAHLRRLVGGAGMRGARHAAADVDHDLPAVRARVAHVGYGHPVRVQRGRHVELDGGARRQRAAGGRWGVCLGL